MKEQIFEHKWLDPECITNGCKSLFLNEALKEIEALQKENSELRQQVAEEKSNLSTDDGMYAAKCRELQRAESTLAACREALNYVANDFDPEQALGPPCGPEALQRIRAALAHAPAAGGAEREASEQHPRYIVWVGSRQFYLCPTLEEATTWKSRTGGTVYALLLSRPLLEKDYAELEQLRKENHDLHSECGHREADVKDLRQQIDRLQAEAGAMQSFIEPYYNHLKNDEKFLAAKGLARLEAAKSCLSGKAGTTFLQRLRDAEATAKRRGELLQKALAFGQGRDAAVLFSHECSCNCDACQRARERTAIRDSIRAELEQP